MADETPPDTAPYSGEQPRIVAPPAMDSSSDQATGGRPTSGQAESASSAPASGGAPAAPTAPVPPNPPQSAAGPPEQGQRRVTRHITTTSTRTETTTEETVVEPVLLAPPVYAAPGSEHPRPVG